MSLPDATTNATPAKMMKSKINSLLKSHFPETRFGGFSRVDGTVAFYCRVRSLVQRDFVVLDVGCGRGVDLITDTVRYRRELRTLRGNCAKVIGIDIDPAAGTNPGIDEFRLITQETWPVDDESINLVLCDFVLEHIDNPNLFFKELSRVLKPGGVFCARTTNACGYVSFFSLIIPSRFHKYVLNYAQPKRLSVDIFRLSRRANSKKKIQHLFAENNLAGVVYGYDSDPAYFEFSSMAYSAVLLVHWLTPPALKSGLLAFGEKISIRSSVAPN